MTNSYLSIKDLSEYLAIQASTLYAWVSQGKIPFVKIHGLIRFRREEIDGWLKSFRAEKPKLSTPRPNRKSPTDLDTLIATAKREVYNTRKGEIEPVSSARKGGK